MRRTRGPRGLSLALAVVVMLAAPAVAAAADPVTPPPARAVSADIGPDASAGPSVSRSLLLLLAAAALVATAGAVWQERGSPRALAHGRVARRPRREVGTTAYRVARRLGFRYSHSRDALVLRGVGNSIGPVLRLRTDPALPVAPRPRPSTGPSRRTVDLVCLPLPATQHGRLWQLTAVDVDSGYTWAELTRPRGAAPSPEQTLAFVQRIAAQLAGRSLQLDAIVVQPGSAHRRALSTAVELADVRLARGLPDGRRAPAAARRHQELVRERWERVLFQGGAPPLDLLERQLQQWIAIDNETAGNVPLAAGEGAAELSPSAALGGVIVAGGGHRRPDAREAAPTVPVGGPERR